MDAPEPIWNHLEALRLVVLKTLYTVLIGMLVIFLYFDEILSFFKQSSSVRLVLLSPTEGLVLALKGSFWLSLAAFFPVWGFFWIRFLTPALHPREKILMIPFLLISLFLMILGIMLAYFVTLPIALPLLTAFNETLGENLWSVSSFFQFYLLVLAGSAFAFELVAILFTAVLAGWISYETLKNYRRHAILGAFILAALVTPPDVPTQFLVAIPLVILYEGAILFASWRGHSFDHAHRDHQSKNATLLLPSKNDQLDS